MLVFIPNTPEQPNSTWRTTHGDMTDEEWDLIADLVQSIQAEVAWAAQRSMLAATSSMPFSM